MIGAASERAILSVTPMLSTALPILLAVAAVQPQVPAKPDATGLVEQARLLVPRFEGDHKAFLTEAEEREVRAAAKLLEAAIALEPTSTFALWWHGHCSVLLGEDARNRGDRERSEGYYRAALESFDRTTEEDPSYYWAWYSRGMAERNIDHFWRAIEAFDRAVDVADAAMSASPPDEGAPFVRFKARQWRADTRMRIFEFDRARAEFRAFYADNGNNAWDLGYSLAETYLRESDLAAARTTYEEIAADPEFAKYDSTYAELAYIAGLAGDQELAVERIQKALQLEFQPSLYPRVWLWILSQGEEHEQARADLAEFLEFPPDDLSPWDRDLGRFLIGDQSSEDFLERARAEVERRKREAIALDDLMCEVWFYIGIRHDLREENDRALEAYRNALAFRPAQHKWEWCYARHGLARVAARTGASAAPGFQLAGDRISFHGEPWVIGTESGLAGELVTWTLHTPGEPKPTKPSPIDPASLHPGDLVRVTLRTDDGDMRAVRVVVGVE